MSAVKFPAYIRTYGTSEYEADIDRYIECLERHYKVKLRDSPACIKMVDQLKTGVKDCKRHLREARKRKAMIIQKFLHELTWEPPFQRAMRKMREKTLFPALAPASGSLQLSLSPATLSTRYTEYSPSSPTPSPSANAVKHPNTAFASPTEHELIISKSEEATKITSTTTGLSCPLPPVMLTNIHMLVSPLQSFEKIKCVNPPKKEPPIEVIEPDEWELLDKDTCLRLVIRRYSPFNGIFEFSLVNACSHILLVYYRGLTDTSSFKSGSIRPRYMLRLVPGLSHPYVFKFTLNEGVDDFSTSLFFKVAKTKPRYDAHPLGPFQALLIPITAYRKGENVSVTESVVIPSAYFWHVNEKHGYSFGVLRVISKDDRPYIVSIVRCPNDLEEDVSSAESAQDGSPVNSLDSSPKINKKVHSKIKQEPTKLSPKKIVRSIVQEIVDRSLEPFLFQRTFFQVPPSSTRSINVYFAKALYIGQHQALYKLIFMNPKNNVVKFTKRVIIYAEALPIPIAINPHSILDLTSTPLCHGYCEDYFTITNKHNLYGSMIRIQLTTKQEKLITIDPMEVEIPRLATIRFRVRFCTRDYIKSKASDKPVEYYVHFTIKISVRGMDVVYSGCPIIYYEIIAPCVTDYTKVYKHELTQKNLM